jgi:hypothetical protein
MLRVVPVHPPVDDGRLDQIAREIAETQNQGAIHIGELLHEAREIYRYKRDDEGFLAWIDQRLSMSRRTVYRLVNVYEKLGRENVCQQWQTLPVQVLYEISAPKVPDAVRHEVIARAERGEIITPSVVKQLRQDAEEEKLPQRKKKTLKAKREARLAAVVKREAEAEIEHNRRIEASRACVSLVVDVFGPRLSELQKLLADAYDHDFYHGLLRAEAD